MNGGLTGLERHEGGVINDRISFLGELYPIMKYFFIVNLK